MILLLIPFFYIFIKLFIFHIVSKYGKLSYDGFSSFGFVYDSEKHVFYSTKDAWQKKFGYCYFYDICAPFFRMIIDTEIIKFNYDNKNYLIVFWKGQYGIVTGAEIGIYCTNDKYINKNTLYFPVDKDNELNMCINLYRKKEKILTMCAKHWWLGIFKIGLFSYPKNLTMRISINFKNKKMLNSFLDSFKKLGYKSNDYEVYHNTFIFNYKKPRTPKVWSRFWLSDYFIQLKNKKNVILYNTYLSDIIDDNNIDDSKIQQNKIILINKFIPTIFKNEEIINNGNNYE